MDQLKHLFDDLSKNISEFCIGDSSQIDDIEKLINKLLKIFTKKKSLKLFIVLNAFKSYLLQLKDKRVTSTFPLETGLILIKSLISHFEKGVDFTFDMTDVIKNLDQTFLKYEEVPAPANLENDPGLQDKDPLNEDPLNKDRQRDKNVSEDFLRLKELVTDLSIKIGLLSPDEIPELGSLMRILDDIVSLSGQMEYHTIYQVSKAFESYVEKMTRGETVSALPLEKGLTLLKALIMHIEINEEFIFDISDVMSLLGVPFAEEEVRPGIKDTASLNDPVIEKKSKPISESPPEPEPEQLPEPEDLSLEDFQILSDFVVEAGENLDSIEVDIVELEQDPADGGIINTIFRPFHTIKGISGFLGLKKMNRLAHMTENLLDGARNNEFVLNKDGFDAILRSVDVLKRLLGRVNEGLAVNKMPRDHDIDIKAQIDVLQKLPGILSSDQKEPLGKLLIRQGILDEESLNTALSEQETQPEKKIGEVLVETNLASSKQVASALMRQGSVSKASPTHVKVDIDKLGDLVDFAGELVIAQSMLKQVALKDEQVQKNIGQLGQIVSKIQNIAMSMRMIPIKATFMKMIRLVRDLSLKSGKNVGLHMVGEDTEIDRNVVDALYEPMVHMVRNSIDHGLETRVERLAAGKPEQGNIFLRAFQKGGNIVIEIEDDGQGLDTLKIFEKAISKGLISDEANLNDRQIFELIMEPGFSTAQSITDISGRGVGMDVVKSGIEKLRGFIDIQSKTGQFTKFTISLPLTLAIIDGMLVRVQKERFIIPIYAIQRSFRPEQQECFTVEGKKEMIRDRGSLVPLIRMDSICQMEEQALTPPWESLVVIVESKDQKKGLLIDELLGKGEYVIKTLGGSLKNIPGFSGGAILGDGKVGLILDIQGIFDISLQS